MLSNGCSLLAISNNAIAVDNRVADNAQVCLVPHVAHVCSSRDKRKHVWVQHNFEYTPCDVMRGVPPFKFIFYKKLKKKRKLDVRFLLFTSINI